MSDREPEEQSFGELFVAAMRSTAFGRLAPGAAPTGRDLIIAVGGAWGLVESIAPGLAFLVAYAVGTFVLRAPDATVLLWAVGLPVVLCIVFLVLRIARRERLRSALTGILVAAVTAGLALITGRTEDSFLPGILTNAVSLLVLLVTLAVRWPLVGIIVGALSGDLSAWRRVPSQRRVLTIATWLWVALFAVRLAVEVPLYLAEQTAWLAVAKLILGVPAYALMIWVTWLMVGSVLTATTPSVERAGDASDESAPR